VLHYAACHRKEPVFARPSGAPLKGRDVAIGQISL
jgi:hypothetical protein